MRFSIDLMDEEPYECDLCGSSWDSLEGFYDVDDNEWHAYYNYGCTGGESFYGDLPGLIEFVKQVSEVWPERRQEFKAVLNWLRAMQ